MRDREEIYEEFVELDELPKKLGREDAKARGLQFEKLALDLFESENLVKKKSYHTSDNRSEQIDGALILDGTRALLEVKWVSSGLAASDLYAFLGKVENKFIGTIGIFISRENLSDNFLRSLKSGRRQSVLVIHGNDVDHIFMPNFSVAEYIRSIIDHISYDNNTHFSASDFIKNVKFKKKKTPKIHRLVTKSLTEKNYTNIIYEWLEEIDEDTAVLIVTQAIDVYSIGQSKEELSTITKENIISLCKECLAKFPDKETIADKAYFEQLSSDFIKSSIFDLYEIFCDRFQYLGKRFRTKFGKRLQKQWNKHIGDYYSENTLAEITSPIWGSLDKETKEFLTKIFLSFINSGRRTHYPQMRLALKVLRYSKPEETDHLVRELLEENISYWVEEDAKEKDWKDKIPKWYSRQYAKWEDYLLKPVEDTILEVIENITGNNS